MARFVPQRIRPFFADVNHDDLLTLAELIESGKITPVIDRTYPLSEIFEAIGNLERDTPAARSSSPCKARPTHRPGQQAVEATESLAACAGASYRVLAGGPSPWPPKQRRAMLAVTDTQAAGRLRARRHQMFRRARPPGRWSALRGLPRSR